MKKIIKSIFEFSIEKFMNQFLEFFFKYQFVMFVFAAHVCVAVCVGSIPRKVVDLQHSFLFGLALAAFSSLVFGMLMYSRFKHYYWPKQWALTFSCVVPPFLTSFAVLLLHRSFSEGLLLSLGISAAMLIYQIRMYSRKKDKN